MKLVRRGDLEHRVETALRRSRCVALIGPRQCGKTTLARAVARGRGAEYFDLEDPMTEARLQNPKLALEGIRGLAVMDEIQRRPDLLPVLRVLLDRTPLPARFLLLGSVSPALLRGASESLAGRIEFVEMGGFTWEETGEKSIARLWMRGGFPRSFLAASDRDSLAWRRNFLRTFFERDLRMLGYEVAPEPMRRFLTMTAHYHGQTWNSSDVASSLQIAHTTARRYLDLLTGAYLVRQLPPWHGNVGKRVVKSPKVYLRDSGILHALLGLTSRRELDGHPKVGVSWEGFALETVLRHMGDEDAYFWATHAGAELDLLLVRGSKRLGVEFKYTEQPKATKSMHVACNDLKLSRLHIVYPGREAFRITEKIVAVPLTQAVKNLSMASG